MLDKRGSNKGGKMTLYSHLRGNHWDTYTKLCPVLHLNCCIGRGRVKMCEDPMQQGMEVVMVGPDHTSSQTVGVINWCENQRDKR